MSLPFIVYKCTRSQLMTLLQDAYALIESWIRYGTYHGHQDQAREVIAGWAMVDFGERIVVAVLAARGVDLAELHELLEECANETEERDTLASWERARLTFMAERAGA